MNKYVCVRKMAHALYGDVILAQDRTTQVFVAIKRIHLTCADRQVTQRGSYRVHEDAMTEIHVNRLLSQQKAHRHVLRLRDSFEENNQYFLVFDYCVHGDLFGLVKHVGHFDEGTALRYVHQILTGLLHLHENGYAHRDLSLENVLVNEANECQLCDFGLVAPVRETCRDCVGKKLYMAPEVQMHGRYDPAQADMWSIGIIAFVLLTGTPPFDEATLMDRGFVFMKHHGIEKLIQVWHLEHFSRETLELLGGLLQVDPTKRMTLHQALDHSAFEILATTKVNDGSAFDDAQGLQTAAPDINNQARNNNQTRNNNTTCPPSPIIVAHFCQVPTNACGASTMKIRAPVVCEGQGPWKDLNSKRKKKLRGGIFRWIQRIKRKSKHDHSCGEVTSARWATMVCH